jgi:hypothetical protein
MNIGPPATSRMTKRAPSVISGGIDVTDDAMWRHVVTVTDMTGPRIGGRRGQVDRVEKFKAHDTGIVLADAAIVASAWISPANGKSGWLRRHCRRAVIAAMFN